MRSSNVVVVDSGRCPNGHVYGVGRAWALRSWMPCKCPTAIDFDIGDGERRHGHRTIQCRECLTTVYEPPCPKWEASIAENRRLAEQARQRLAARRAAEGEPPDECDV